MYQMGFNIKLCKVALLLTESEGAIRTVIKRVSQKIECSPLSPIPPAGGVSTLSRHPLKGVEFIKNSPARMNSSYPEGQNFVFAE